MGFKCNFGSFRCVISRTAPDERLFPAGFAPCWWSSVAVPSLIHGPQRRGGGDAAADSTPAPTPHSHLLPRSRLGRGRDNARCSEQQHAGCLGAHLVQGQRSWEEARRSPQRALDGGCAGTGQRPVWGLAGEPRPQSLGLWPSEPWRVRVHGRSRPRTWSRNPLWPPGTAGGGVPAEGRPVRLGSEPTLCWVRFDAV